MSNSNYQKLKINQKISCMDHNQRKSFNQNVESQHTPPPKKGLDEN